MKQLTKFFLLFLLLSSSIFFLPVSCTSAAENTSNEKEVKDSGKSETGTIDLHRNAGLASLQ